MDEPYFSFNRFLRQRFGSKVLKISVDGGFSCPNKDGTLSTAGCIFCDRYGAAVVKNYQRELNVQIESYQLRHPGKKYIVYFQAHSNTYAPADHLQRLFLWALKFEQVVGLAIATRPDCLPPEVLKVLAELNKKTYLIVELGLQSVHEKSLRYLNRNHTYSDFLDAFRKLQTIGVDVFVHLILGLPEETETDMLFTLEEMNRIKPRGVKFHLLHILKETKLAEIYQRENFKLLSAEEYRDLLIFLLERLDPEIVVQRLLPDREAELLLAPLWIKQKTIFLQDLRRRMQELPTYQGRLFKR